MSTSLYLLSLARGGPVFHRNAISSKCYFIKELFHRTHIRVLFHRMHIKGTCSPNLWGYLSHIFDELPPSAILPNAHKGWHFIKPTQVVLFTKSSMKHVDTFGERDHLCRFDEIALYAFTPPHSLNDTQLSSFLPPLTKPRAFPANLACPAEKRL